LEGESNRIYLEGRSELVNENQQKSRDKKMRTTTGHHRIRRQGGYVMVSAMALTLVMLGVGLAFMQWATEESIQSQHNLAGIQASYIAKTGVIEEGLHWLRTQQAGLLPRSEIRLQGGEVRVDHEVVGTFDSVFVSPVLAGDETSDIFFSRSKFRISSVGTVNLPWYEDGRKKIKPVKRKAILYVSVRSFVDYMYLTDHEVTPLGEFVRFFGGDTLWGRTHSNDSIRMMQEPVFYKLVTSSGKIIDDQASPRYYGGKEEEVPKIIIPTVARTVRDGAEAQNNVGFDLPGMEYLLSIRGRNARMFWWEEGAPFDSLTAQSADIPGGDNTCIFVERLLSVHGIVDGAWTIGCSEDIYLIDDLSYEELDWQHDYTIPPDCDDFCGIVSEKRVVIANTWANGRDNQAQGSNIIICAAIVALGEEAGSFTFDQQNDIWDTYIGPNPDERGRIHLRGSVTQRFRGYVHRSNNGGTGYLKDYDYDTRFLLNRPPCFLDAVDQSGRALFDFVQWGQAVEDPSDVSRDIRVRYN
jgi:hypothetical protein